MDGLTANVALVIDNSQTLLEKACRKVRELGDIFDTNGVHPTWTREEFVTFQFAEELAANVVCYSQEIVERNHLSSPARDYVAIALDWMRTSVNWNDLARHYVQKAEEGVA